NITFFDIIMAPEEEYFESCKQYLDVPEAIGLDGIDLESYIIASYVIKRPKGQNV
ncbi:unnamed protein product, partial [marine sediment metagenome]